MRRWSVYSLRDVTFRTEKGYEFRARLTNTYAKQHSKSLCSQRFSKDSCRETSNHDHDRDVAHFQCTKELKSQDAHSLVGEPIRRQEAMEQLRLLDIRDPRATPFSRFSAAKSRFVSEKCRRCRHMNHFGYAGGRDREPVCYRVSLLHG